MSETPLAPGGPLTPAASAALGEDQTVAAVRARAVQVVGVPSVPVCGLIRLLAGAANASHAVELGGAGGVTAAWITSGMAERGVLTSIEPDPHRHQLAAAGWADVQIDEQVRGILGEPLPVLGRLRDGQYDLAVIQSPVTEAVLDELHRILRAEAVLVAIVAADSGGLDDLIAAHEGFDDVALPLDLGVIVARTV